MSEHFILFYWFEMFSPFRGIHLTCICIFMNYDFHKQNSRHGNQHKTILGEWCVGNSSGKHGNENSSWNRHMLGRASSVKNTSIRFTPIIQKKVFLRHGKHSKGIQLYMKVSYFIIKSKKAVKFYRENHVVASMYNVHT